MDYDKLEKAILDSMEKQCPSSKYLEWVMVDNSFSYAKIKRLDKLGRIWWAFKTPVCAQIRKKKYRGC